MSKASATRKTHLTVSVLLAVMFGAFVGISQSSAHAKMPVVSTSARGAKSLSAIAALTLGVSVVAKMTSDIKFDVLREKTRTRNIRLALAAYKRARLVRISRNYSRPTSNYKLTAGFGDRSWLWSTRHTGQDFAAPYGTPVKAAESGTVVFAGWDGSYGLKIAVASPGGIQIWYGHLSKIHVKVGQHVTVAHFIGRVGATGHATGSHLHFEVQRYGVPIDPVKWLRAVGILV